MSSTFIPSSGSVDINSPEIPRSGKLPGGEPPVRAIASDEQAASIVRRLEQDNRDRNIKNARIQSRYDAEKPFPAGNLIAEGLAWKSNFPTQPMANLVDKVAPRFKRAVSSAKYLTASKLPETFPGASFKTEKFRREITELCRSHPCWDDLIGEIGQEDALFGYTAAGWLDEWSWFPTHFRGDRFLIPQGTKQHARQAQVVCFIEYYQPHELWEKISDGDAAEAAGWDVPSAIEAINNAQPAAVRANSAEQNRVYTDLLRENNLANSLASGAKEIVIYNVLVYEVTGKVSHWKMAYPDMKVLFKKEDRFKSMDWAACFFSFQQAGGTMHSSKGIGRMVYAMAGVIDRARNEVVDRLQLAGKVIVQGPDKDLARFRMSVYGNAILIGQGFEIAQQSIDPRVEEFITLDTYLQNLLDQQTGNVSPHQLKGERVTNDQVNLFAHREEETKDNVLSRFVKQVATMVSTIQKRACNSSCDDEDAVEMRKRLLDVMSEEELEILANSPAAQVVDDLTEARRQAIAIFGAEQAGNPLFDQRELQRRRTAAIFDEEFADAVMSQENDPTQEAEQRRQQTLENVALRQGEQILVSPRDNHRLHIETMEPVLQQQVDSLLQQGAEGAQLLQPMLVHAREHATMGEQEGQEVEFFREFLKKLDQLQDSVQKMVVFEANVQEMVQSGVPQEEALAAASKAAGLTAPPVA
jgi:hypothetical protein